MTVTSLRPDAVEITWTPPVNTIDPLQYYQIVVEKISFILVAVENVSADDLSVTIGSLGMCNDT